MDKRIVKAAIHPGIGIARVGDSVDLDGFFIGPEVRSPLGAIFTTYLKNRREYYAQERRWASRPFWRRRVRS